MRNSFRWRELAVITLSMALAWGFRGQHGHERGAAIAGAMAGLSFAAVTGGPRWIGAAVIGSMTFAIGGSLSYGRFVSLAYAGSWEAILSLALIGVAWGGLGSLGLGLGLTLSQYRLWERGTIAGGLLVVWFLVDHLLWGRLTGPQDLATRQMMALVLLGSWAFLCAYVGVWRRDRASLRLAIAGAAGFGLGFPLAAWIQGVGQTTGIPVDWWKVAEHLIGLCGGSALGIAAVTLEPSWTLPLAVRPLERWLATVWLLWLLPCWLIANNLDFWVVEQALLPVWVGKAAWGALSLILVGLALWGWAEIRRGRTFVISWSPAQLRTLFLSFLWVVTFISASKDLTHGPLPHPTSIVFFLLALLVTWSLRAGCKTSRGRAGRSCQPGKARGGGVS
ncbi:MAG: hypothetical protein HYZ93_00470 [Candidatus Omnitrophica bacterium]|nr:hypothetical protein [Candidatus Omnitrophota bacterium]